MLENASSAPPNKYLTSDVLSGIGIRNSAFNAPTTGSSTIKVLVSPSQISARPSTLPETVSPAMMDTFSELENASWLPNKNPQTSAVDFGTGKVKSVSNAPTTGFSTAKEFAFLSQINAPLSTLPETVFLATKDTDLLLEDANLLLFSKLLTSAVALGIGTSKFV